MRGLVHCAIPGQLKRSVYGSKSIENGYFMLTRYFLYTEIHLMPIAPEELRRAYRVPYTAP